MKGYRNVKTSVGKKWRFGCEIERCNRFSCLILQIGIPYSLRAVGLLS